MKAKYILLAFLTMGLTFNAEAQFLKKLKKKAEQAAERAVMKKTDQIVTEKTEKTIDDVTEGKDKDPQVQTTGSQSPSPQNTPGAPSMNPMSPDSADTSNLPSAYDFNWEYKTEIVTGKDQKVEMNYLINTETTDYFGMEMSNEQSKGQGDIHMVMDSKNKKTVMLMEGNGQKMAQVMKMPNTNAKAKGNTDNYKFTEIGTKTILGYECFGMQVEDQKYVATMYYTLDAPVTFSALFGMANMKNAPKGFDPALVQVLAEESLLMEMTATNKKKTKESFTMTAKSLNKKNTSIKMNEYQVMGLGGF